MWTILFFCATLVLLLTFKMLVRNLHEDLREDSRSWTHADHKINVARANKTIWCTCEADLSWLATIFLYASMYFDKIYLGSFNGTGCLYFEVVCFESYGENTITWCSMTLCEQSIMCTNSPPTHTGARHQ